MADTGERDVRDRLAEALFVFTTGMDWARADGPAGAPVMTAPAIHDPAPPRRHISNSERARLFTIHGGLCHLCGLKIDGVRERWQVEHVIPWAMSRDDSDANRKPAHEACHAVKTTQDRTDLAKADRIRLKHQGAWKSKSPMRSRKKPSVGLTISTDPQDDGGRG